VRQVLHDGEHRQTSGRRTQACTFEQQRGLRFSRHDQRKIPNPKLDLF
jgi:hypothetical protein